MSDQIPQVRFESNITEINGIELIRLESIASRENGMDHEPQKPHKIDFYQFIFYTEGVTEHLVDFDWYKAQKNSLFYLAQGQINAFKFKPDVRGFVLLFTEEYLRKQLNNLPQDTALRLLASHLFSPKLQIPGSSNVINYTHILFDEFNKMDSSFNKEAIIDSLFTIILSKLEELKKEQTSYIKDSDKLNRFFEFQLLLKKEYVKNRNANYYAQQMHITYKHLNEICKEIINSTAKQFIDEFVILEAKRRLTNSSIKSTELAYQLGFEEPTNFAKYFKKITGFTPNQFKKSV